MKKIINATPHSVAVVSASGLVVATYESELVVRVSCTTEVVGELNGIPLMNERLGNVEGLPSEQSNTYYIVSRLVKQALPNRGDLLVPCDFVRDEKGVIVGCKSFLI